MKNERSTKNDMSNKQPDFYKAKDLFKLRKGAQYIMLLSSRNDGKSYAVKTVTLQEAYNAIDADGICHMQIAYIRRFDLDVKDSLLEPYFADMPIQEITHNDYTHVFVYHKDIFFGTIDQKTGRHLKQVKIGHCFAISAAEHAKSLMYPEIRQGIVEEIVSKKNQYIFNEPEELQHLISSIFRHRTENVHIYMIGNTLSPVCPYYQDWGLKGIESMTEGQTMQFQIDDTIIHAHRPKPSGFDSKLFFGSAKNEITKGEYVVDSYPHLKKHIRKYIILYTMVMEHDTFKYLLRLVRDPEDNSIFWYCENKTTDIEEGSRIISNNWYEGNLYTPTLTGLTQEEQKAFNLIKQRRIVFNTNLTGTLFNSMLKFFA